MKPWKDLFRTHILERGLNYYEEGYVTSLEQTSTGYTAVVEGTEPLLKKRQSSLWMSHAQIWTMEIKSVF